jgi:competence protein ComK
MLIEPEVYGSKIYSRIYETESEFIAPFKPFEIINASCLFYCSSYRGRLEGSHNAIGKVHKTPISISPTLFFFPTTSPNRLECTWVNDQHILTYRRHTSKLTLVTFSNQITYEMGVSVRTFEKQYLRTSSLRDKFVQRMKGIERKNNHFHFYIPNYISAENKGRYGKMQNMIPPQLLD